MVKPKADKPRGLLNQKTGQTKFQLFRYSPGPDLGYFLEHYWIVEWDLRGQEPYISETLPYPSVHLVIEKNKSEVVGVMTGKFCRWLEGQGRVLGVKFRPGAFYPFYKAPVSGFTD